MTRFMLNIWCLLLVSCISIQAQDVDASEQRVLLDSLHAIVLIHPTLDELNNYIKEENETPSRLEEKMLDLRTPIADFLDTEVDKVEFHFAVDRPEEDLSIQLRGQDFTYSKQIIQAVPPVSGAFCPILPQGYRSMYKLKIKQATYLLTLDVLLLK